MQHFMPKFTNNSPESITNDNNNQNFKDKNNLNTNNFDAGGLPDELNTTNML